MEKIYIVLIVASVLLQQFASCHGAELKSQVKDEIESSSKGQVNGLLPLLVLRQESREEKPDFFLIWMKPYEQMIPQQIQDMINSQVRPQTEQISGQMISNLPGAEQAYAQISQIQNIVNQMGLGNMLGSGENGEGGDNPLSSLMQNFGRRR